jgi:hypothetical protein
VGDPAERPSEHENGYKQVPHSRSLPCQTAKVKGHLFSSSLVIFSIEVVETHMFLERVHTF